MDNFHAVGSTFEHEGKKFKVKEATSCKCCASLYTEFLCGLDVCRAATREDCKSVIFIKVKDKKKKTTAIETSDGFTAKAEVDSNGNIAVYPVQGYTPDVDTLCTLADNGNGYHVKVPSYSSVCPDHIFNLDYSEIEYIYLAYKALKKSRKEKK